MKYSEVINLLKSNANKKNVEGMTRFGINPNNTLGISVYDIRAMAKNIGKDHSLALKLWDSGIHEARLLAGFIADPKQTNEDMMEKWAKDFDSWDICDQVCSNLFDRTSLAYKKAFDWSKRKDEFVKRAGFVMMAALSVHDKKADDKKIEKFLPVIKRECRDERNFVKKAVNWALRQTGKRSLYLNKKAIKTAKEIEKVDSSAAKWIAKDALRELTSEKVQLRF